MKLTSPDFGAQRLLANSRNEHKARKLSKETKTEKAALSAENRPTQTKNVQQLAQKSSLLNK